MPYASKKDANACRRRMLKRRKDELVALLGGKCEVCGSVEMLTIEHKDGRDYCIRKLSSLQRLKKYKEEFLSGVKLALMCLSCNSSDGNYWSQFYEDNPEMKTRRAKKVPWVPPVIVEEPFDEDSRA
jgi:hypothetical protein